MRKKLRGILLSWLVMASHAALAEVVELRLPDKLVARAEFRQGDPSKPAVFLLHGFLQTHAFPTISRLTDSLASEGYTVLAPTLSLGVTHRKKSLACEAIHGHTLAGGVAEIKAWLAWFKARKASTIILGGHSVGNIYLLAYLSKYPDEHVKKLVGISIMEGSLKGGESARSPNVAKLRAKVQSDGKGLFEGQYSFCQKYRSTHQSLLSYLEWGPDRILTSINQVKVPVAMIMGSKDELLGKDWLERLKKTRAKVTLIEGANHFMDGQYEFDLIDHFLAELKGI